MEKKYTIVFKLDTIEQESGCAICHLDRNHCCYICAGEGMFILKEVGNDIQMDIPYYKGDG